MRPLLYTFTPKCDGNIIIPFPVLHNSSSPIRTLSHNFPSSSKSKSIPYPKGAAGTPQFLSTVVRSQSPSNLRSGDEDEDEDPESQVQELRVPDHWSQPSKAAEEARWLRATLHKWLDDEYCPEETNVEISMVAAKSYYDSLLWKQTDLGEILLKMAGELESISYKESFHGAFSSANAAVNLIAQRIELEGKMSQ